ncbi:OPT oligopeptide transporter protein-domain-containing protein [Aspergillus undulatus]|uniref:OPT oligopeptide transporter protein-domain-containing protein n=1 Tax=Aspergillus undulatus TaxID=1810928 RepID=UPI003CCDE445
MAGLYYGNAWDAKTFPFMSTALFLSNRTTFSPDSITNRQGTIDFDKLEQVGLPNLTASTVWGYLTQSIGALITHVLIFCCKDIATAWKQAWSKTQPDPHYQVMLKYKEVPIWWYYVSFVLTFFERPNSTKPQQPSHYLVSCQGSLRHTVATSSCPSVF